MEMMNEWELQHELTKKWTESGLHLNGRRHLLVAWEVMVPSWGINDKNKNWTEPSLDFLVADDQMRLTVIELKTEIHGIKPAWHALCQVTHRAVEVAKTFSEAKLKQAFSDCWSGKHGRLPPSNTKLSFAEYYQRFFGVSDYPSDSSRAIGRCIAARKFGESWPDVLKEFNQLSGAQLEARVCDELTSEQARRELDRFKGISGDDFSRLAGPVIALNVLD